MGAAGIRLIVIKHWRTAAQSMRNEKFESAPWIESFYSTDSSDLSTQGFAVYGGSPKGLCT